MASTSILVGEAGSYAGPNSEGWSAHLRHSAISADIYECTVDLLNSGHIPTVEDGLNLVVPDAHDVGNLEFTVGSETEASDADSVSLHVPIHHRDVRFADVSDSGAADVQIAPTPRNGAVVVDKSTAPIGLTVAVEKSDEVKAAGLGYDGVGRR